MILKFCVIFGMVFGLMLVAYEDNVPFFMFNTLRCKLGWHKNYIKLAGIKIHKYYCLICKMPRKHPPLTVVDGGKKLGNNRFNF